eukprot:676334-Amphidinium_carterae.1
MQAVVDSFMNTVVAEREIKAEDRAFILFRHMVDEAILVMLQMRTGAVEGQCCPRQMMRLVAPYLPDTVENQKCFPKSLDYLRRKAPCKAKP